MVIPKQEKKIEMKILMEVLDFLIFGPYKNLRKEEQVILLSFWNLVCC